MLRSIQLTRIALLASLAFMVAGCGPETDSSVETPRPVKLHTVADPLGSQLREFPARLRSPEEAQLSFRTGGELQQLRVREGQRVRKGEVIAELDATDYQLRLNDRQAAFDLSRSQLDRMEQLVDRQMVSRAEFDERRAQFNQAEAALNLARQEVAHTRLLAPFDGLVARSHVERYQVVQANQPIVTLYAGDSMDVVFQLPETLLSRIRTDFVPGEYQPLVRLDSLPDVQLPGVYKEHASQPDPQTLTYQVALNIQPPPGMLLLPGMSATVVVDFARMRSQGQDRLLVPVESVFSPDAGDSEQRQVWVVLEGEDGLRVTARDVTVGQLTHTGIEVLGGLEPGERIVAAGGGELSEGRQVIPWVRERGL
jgi:RND family efflux transporter MFP subunit